MRRRSRLYFLLLVWALTQIAACAHVRAGELPITTIVEKMTSGAVFKLGPEQVKPYFEGLAKLDSKGPGKELWVHDSVAPGNDIRWLRIEFQPSAGKIKKWVFLQGAIALPTSTSAYPDIYKHLRDQLAKKLGKPEMSDEQADEKSTVWAMGGARKVILRRGAFDNPYLKKTQNLVLLEAAIAQGDEESPGK